MSEPLRPPAKGATLGRSIVLKGDIHADEDLYLDGRLEGTVDLGQHRLTIGPHAQVRATIRARDVDIMGRVHGNVDASGRISIRANAQLTGDLKMAGIVIEDGAYFKGSIDITHPDAKPPEPEPPGE